jgi:hypothetical protein
VTSEKMAVELPSSEHGEGGRGPRTFRPSTPRTPATTCCASSTPARVEEGPSSLNGHPTASTSRTCKRAGRYAKPARAWKARPVSRFKIGSNWLVPLPKTWAKPGSVDTPRSDYQTGRVVFLPLGVRTATAKDRRPDTFGSGAYPLHLYAGGRSSLTQRCGGACMRRSGYSFEGDVR